MAAKKHLESPNQRRQRLLDYFHSRSKKARFIAEIKEDLKVKNEQNLRRDLELLTEAGILEKTKDFTQQPARALFTLKPDAPKVLATQEPALSMSKTNSDNKPLEQAIKQNKNIDETSVQTALGRTAARELEQQILSVLEQKPTTVQDLSKQLNRKQPTVTKALERMIERKLIERKRQGRSYLYFRMLKLSGSKSLQASVHLQNQDALLASLPNLHHIIESAVHAAINAAVDRILAERLK